MPPLIPKRTKSRLKYAFTVRSAMFKSRAISELSHPCNSKSTICRSRGPIWSIFSSIVYTSRRAPRTEGRESNQTRTRAHQDFGFVAEWFSIFAANWHPEH